MSPTNILRRKRTIVGHEPKYMSEGVGGYNAEVASGEPRPLLPEIPRSKYEVARLSPALSVSACLRSVSLCQGPFLTWRHPVERAEHVSSFSPTCLAICR